MHYKLKTIILVCALSLITLVVRAQQPTKTVYTLTTLTDLALTNNYKLKANYLNDSLSYAEISALAKNKLPKITATGSYAYYDWLMPNKQNLLGGNVNTDMLIEFAAYQTIYDWNRTKLSKQLQLSDISINQEFTRQLKTTIIYAVTQSYLEVLKAKKKVEVFQNTIKQLNNQFQIANNLYKIAKVSNIDLLKIKVNISVNTKKLTTAKSEYQQLLSDLKNSALLEHEGTISIEDNVEYWYQFYLNFPENNIKNNSFQNHPTLKIYDKHIAKEELSEKLIVQQNRPELFSFAATNWESAYVPFKNNFNFNVGLGIQYILPYFGGSSYKEKIVQSKIKAAQFEQEKQQSYYDLKKEFDAITISLLNKKQEIESNQSIVKMAEETLNNLLVMYKSGQETMLNVQDAQSIVTQQNILYKQSLVEYLQLVAKLHFIKGQTTYPFNSQNN